MDNSPGTSFSLVAALAFCFVFSVSLEAQQSFTIRLLHSKSGRPIANQNVTVRWGDEFDSSVIVQIDARGIGTVEIPKGIDAFEMVEGPRKGKESYRIAYGDCNKQRTAIRIRNVLENGVDPGDRKYLVHRARSFSGVCRDPGGSRTFSNRSSV